MTSISGEEAVEPETISQSSSPIAFKFSHNVAFKCARVFRYIGTSISGEEAVEPETICQSEAVTYKSVLTVVEADKAVN
jgi:hypothetical protein